jgi:hypothetical protein
MGLWLSSALFISKLALRHMCILAPLPLRYSCPPLTDLNLRLGLFSSTLILLTLLVRPFYRSSHPLLNAPFPSAPYNDSSAPL